MPFNVTTAFPDYVFDGDIIVSDEIITSVMEDVSAILSTGSAVSTPYGSITNKQIPLSGSLKKLQLLVGDYFTKQSNSVMPVYKRNVQILNPYLVLVKPGHCFPVNIEKSRWYNACVWLQTTNKGSHLLLENYNSKLHATPNLLQDDNMVIPPSKFKAAFWPSHIPWGLTYNTSPVDTICFICTFNAPMKKQYLTDW